MFSTMNIENFCIIFTILLIRVMKIQGHGRTMDPVGRGSAWRKGFDTPRDYNDNESFCGGFTVHNIVNKGMCGVCGDNYLTKQPRPHENGGYYGTGTIVKTYKAGETIEVMVHLTASHKGHFEFSLCPLSGKIHLETEKCFEQYPLQLASGGTKYPVISTGNSEHRIKIVLPNGLKCQHCVFRWHYRTGNTAGICNDKSVINGCRPQEVFRTCSDIQII